MLSASIEDYIKAIYWLQADQQRATTKKIAQRLGVKMASVTAMVKHLAAEGYVAHTPYKGATLSEKGHTVALEMIRRHRLIELFLATTLGLSWDEVDADAEVLEHAVSDRLIERIFEYLGRPEFDPHGSPIPGKDGSFPNRQPSVTLDELAEGDRARIAEVSDRDAEFLRYLTSLKLKIGTPVRVVERAPFNGPITLKVGSTTVAIGQEAAHRIRVSTESKSTKKR
ncbi:MAG: metal-dependent transcriptional regulator [bacterium]|nr:metal-dependent transcriptional regulator [bacterium]